MTSLRSWPSTARAYRIRNVAVAGRAYGPKQRRFETVLELDQVIGMRPELLQAVLPYVTVHSRTPGVDPRVAAPALLAALAGFEPARVTQLVGAARGGAGDATPRGVPSQFLSLSPGRSFLVRAEVRTPAGGMFAQEAIVEMTAGEMPDELREWAAWSGSLLFQRRNAPPRHRAPLATVLTDRTDWRRSNPA
jgi:Type II secretion system (T2SS), protein K